MSVLKIKKILFTFKHLKIYLGESKRTSNFASNRAAFMECFVADNYGWLLCQIKDGDVVIDAGANIGMFVLQASKAVGEKGKVIAIEPDSTNLQYLKENIVYNNIKNVEILERALYRSDDEVLLFSGQGVFGKISEKGKEVISISLKSLLIELLKNKTRIFLKMDIEGGEEAAFEDSELIGYLKELSAIAYEIHSENANRLVGDALRSSGFWLSKIYHDHDFKLNIVKSTLRHPILFGRLYGLAIFTVAKRVLIIGKKSYEQFKPGMIYALKYDLSPNETFD